MKRYRRDKKGRFVAAYHRPPRKGTIDRLLFDAIGRHQQITLAGPYRGCSISGVDWGRDFIPIHRVQGSNA